MLFRTIRTENRETNLSRMNNCASCIRN